MIKNALAVKKNLKQKITTTTTMVIFAMNVYVMAMVINKGGQHESREFTG